MTNPIQESQLEQYKDMPRLRQAIWDILSTKIDYQMDDWVGAIQPLEALLAQQYATGYEAGIAAAKAALPKLPKYGDNSEGGRGYKLAIDQATIAIDKLGGGQTDE